MKAILFSACFKTAFTCCIYFMLFACCAHKQGGNPVIAKRKTIAFVNKTATVNHIWLMDIDTAGKGSNARRLTNDAEAENYPSWSPDGHTIIYQRDFNGSAIYSINIDGTHQQRLSPTPGYDATPSFSPDGLSIIYTHIIAPVVAGQPPKTAIKVMNADGSGSHTILPETVFSVEPRWSVNNQVVFMSLMNGSQQIFTMNIDGANVHQLTNEGSSGDAVWGPDGRQISFGSNREGGGKLNIFVMNADGTNVKQLTHFTVPLESGDTNWSADGKKIIFEYDVDGKLQSDPNAYAEVWTMNADGSGQASTMQPCSCVGCAPRWQP